VNDLIVTIAGVVSVAASGFFGWFFGRRKTNAEAASAEIDNDIKLSGYYKELLDDLAQRYEHKFQDLVKLYESKEKALKEEIASLQRRVKMLKTENTELQRRIKELEPKK
jgi:uncharacterized protein HemX